LSQRPLSQLAISAARWPPAAALVALLGAAAVLPEKYGLLPNWASEPLWLLVGVLIVLSTFAHASPLLRRIEGPVTLSLVALVTGLVVFDLARLVELVVTEGAELRGLALLSTAAALWFGNLVVFALWYWLLDRGGPELRLRGISVPPDLHFPAAYATYPEWTPDFIDYIFVAFNTSIAFSPTDTTPVTTRGQAHHDGAGTPLARDPRHRRRARSEHPRLTRGRITASGSRSYRPCGGAPSSPERARTSRGRASSGA
jgi:hypothetical protein